MKILNHRTFTLFADLPEGRCFVNSFESANQLMLKIEKVKTVDDVEANAVNLVDGSLHLIDDDQEVRRVEVKATVKEMKHYD